MSMKATWTVKTARIRMERRHREIFADEMLMLTGGTPLGMSAPASDAASFGPTTAMLRR
jgi:hypothetical protein